jgi:Na+/proline symporter
MVFSTILTVVGWWLGGTGGAIAGLILGIIVDIVIEQWPSSKP